MITKKLISLLHSEDENNIVIAFNLLEQGEFVVSMLPTLLGVSKVHPTKKIRDRATRLLKKHGGEVMEEINKIIKNKKFLSTLIDTKLQKELELMSQVEGFEIEPFIDYIATKHPYHIGMHRFTAEDGDKTEAFILKYLNRKVTTISTIPSPRFLKAKKIEEFTLLEPSTILWKMYWLKCISFDKGAKSLTITNGLENLKELKLLIVLARKVTFSASSEVLESIEFKKCSRIIFDENIVLSNLKILIFSGNNQDLSFDKKFDVKTLKKIMPNLELIETSWDSNARSFIQEHEEVLREIYVDFKIDY